MKIRTKSCFLTMIDVIRVLSVVLIVVIFTAITACDASRKAHLKSETTIIERDTVIYLPSAVVRDTLFFSQRDSVFFRDSLTIIRQTTDSTGRAELLLFINAQNELIAECRAKADTVFIPVVRTVSKTVESPKSDNSATGTNWLKIYAWEIGRASCRERV